MAIPKLKSVIQQVYREGLYQLHTLEGCGEFTRQCAVRLYDSDPRFVMLKKSSGRTHVVDEKGRRHAADAILFLEHGKGTSVDIIGNSRTPEAEPAWTPDKKARYTPADAFVPDYDEVIVAPPPPPIAGTLDVRLARLEAQMADLLGKLRSV
jgi:hypothetical protein